LILELLGHLELLEFVTTVDNQTLDPRKASKHGFDEGLAEGAGAQ